MGYINQHSTSAVRQCKNEVLIQVGFLRQCASYQVQKLAVVCANIIVAKRIMCQVNFSDPKL